MPTDRFDRVNELLLKALKLGQTEREAFLEAECRDDPDLRSEVEALMAGSKSGRVQR